MAEARSSSKSVFLVLSILSRRGTGADISHPEVTISKLAFGSCHKRKYVDRGTGIIWDAIKRESPEAFLWTGDAVYPPLKGVASVEQLRHEYDEMLHNTSLGYADFSPPQGTYGTWDDHDYGGNDLGIEMPEKPARRQAFFDFLQQKPPGSNNRQGVYNSIEWGEPPRKVKVIFLDTRWHRQRHCLPSVATVIPLGAALSCITRWMTAGLFLSRLIPSCRNPSMLGTEQWKWLEDELHSSTAQVHIVVSSVQVLTTNPVMESWGHFEEERHRLLKLLNGIPGLVLLSGDVHHAEILDPTAAANTKKTSFFEVTSSGLTHTCTTPFYGGLCEPLLKAFPAHRYTNGQAVFYYTDRNFGTINIDWEDKRMRVDVHDVDGNAVLSTGQRPFIQDQLTEHELSQVAPCTDGHLIPLAKRMALIFAFSLLLWLTFRRGKDKRAKVKQL